MDRAEALVLDCAAAQRRTLRVLMASQVLSGIGLAAGVTVGALLAEDVLGTTALAGLPAALLTGGSALAAWGVGGLSDRRGRRPGLASGYCAAALGGAAVVVSAVVGSVPLFLLGLVVYGAGTATNLQARYAGADLALPERRGAAISTILVATTVGAVAGPNIVGPVGDVAERVGIPALAGPFALASIAYVLAATVLLVKLRPDPLMAARELSVAQALRDGALPEQRTDRVALRLGGIVMVVTQLVMVAVMTMTPVHMRDHGHGLQATGFVIGLHIAAMFLPSPLTGRLVDRFGPGPVAVGASCSLVLAGVVAAAAPASSMALLALALILLGLGWNLGLVAGTSLVAGAVGPLGRARIQGRLDVAVALAGATGGLSSGMVVSASSYSTLSAGSSVLALVVLAAVVRGGALPRSGRVVHVTAGSTFR